MKARALAATRRVRVALLLLLLGLAVLRGEALAANPELIEAGASQSHFYIEPSYDGTSIILFGSVDSDRLDNKPFDVAVTIRGPIKPVTVWKKARRVGLWINSQNLTFEGVPNYFAVLSTKPVNEIAPREERKAYEIGIDVLNLPVKMGDDTKVQPGAPQEFEDALIKLKRTSSLFVEDSQGAIEFFGARLFRAKVFLPAAAGPGLYRAEFFVLQNGKVIGEANAHMRLNKIGIEARLSSAAVEHPWLYGVLAVLLAAAVGGGASLVFRRA